MESPKVVQLFNELHELFGSRAGSLLRTRQTYIPVGNGSRLFPASDWDYIVDWMRHYEHQDTVLDLLR